MEQEYQWRSPMVGEGFEEEEENVGGSLLVRGRSKKVLQDEVLFRTHVMNGGGGVHVGSGEAEEEHWRSIYFDEADGIQHTSEYIDDKTEEYKAKDEVHGGPVHQSKIEVPRTLVLDSVLLHLNGKMVPDYGVEGQCSDALNVDRQNLPEIDVERVLEEQDTHDLFCPNCRSCITKRVILRKRKRRIKEIHFDTKREKIETVQTITTTTSDADETTAGHPDHKSYVFKCLSCFTFFIPLAEGGFRLFKGFWRKDTVSDNLSSNVQSPVSKSHDDDVGDQQGGKEAASIEVKAGSSTPKNDMATLEKLASKKDIRTLEKLASKDSEMVLPIIGTHETVMLQSSTKLENQNERKTEISIKYGNLMVKEMTVEEHRAHPGEGITSILEDIIEPFPKEALLREPEMDILLPPLCTHLKLEDINKPFPEEAPLREPGLDILSPPLSTQLKEPRQDSPLPLSTPQNSVLVDMPGGIVHDSRSQEWDVLKAIVYGGLVESITSLGVISSAAGADTSTINIVALGLANLIGGLFLIFHNLMELWNEEYDVKNPNNEQATCYGRSLGKRGHFRLHATVALISYIIFGILPPVIYGFSFRRSDSKEYKLIVVAVASLISIALLALAKAHVQGARKPYGKYFLAYILLGISVSCLAYVAGIFIERLLETFHAFDADNSKMLPTPSIEFSQSNVGSTGWSYYK